MYVIAEYLYIENLIINYIILQITKLITKTKVSNKRIIITAIILAFYPFVFFFPRLLFISKFYMKFFISAMTIKLVFNAKSKSLYIKQLSGFYLVSFIFAGASIGAYFFNIDWNIYFSKEKGALGGFSIKYLIMGVILGGIMIKNIIEYYHEKVLRERELLNVSIRFKNQSISMIALLDTGNSLIEPLSKLPVYIVEYNTIKELLPEDFKKVFETNSENNYIALERVMDDLKDSINISLIPFKSVGLKNGILIGFKPDYIMVSYELKEYTYEELIIGIYNGRLSNEEEYNGLLNLQIINKGEVENVN